MLREIDGSLLEVVGVDMRRVPLTAHNLTVEGAETYFVGDAEDAVWVHNCAKRRKENFSAKVKAELEADNAADNNGAYACEECGIAVHPQVGPNKRGQAIASDRLELDHKEAIADGGDPYAKSNGRVLCHECHKKKTMEENKRRNEERKKREEDDDNEDEEN